MPVKFITFTDAHVSTINPMSRRGDYESDIFNKLNQIKLAGEKKKVDFFLFAGDLFNLKAPMRNPHELNSRLITLFKSFPAPIYATEGNHDLRADNYDTFEEQPLNVIYTSGAITQARDVRMTVDGITIRIRSFPFREKPDLLSYSSQGDISDLKICLLHIYSSPAGGSFHHTKLYSYDEIASLGDDVFVLGHYHIDQGIELRNKKLFINVGAISRGAFSEDNCERSPKFGLVEVDKKTTGLEYKYFSVRLNAKPFQEIFDVEKREEDTKKLKEAEAFVSKLQSDLTIVTEDEDKIKSEISKLDIEKAVMDKLMELLEEADMRRKSVEA